MSEIAAEAAAPKVSAGYRLWRGLKEVLPAIALSAVILIVWEMFIRIFNVVTFVLPAPSAIIVSLIKNRASLAVATQATAFEVLFGFVLAAIVGVVVALLIVRFERFGRALYPLIVLFQNVPKVALAPIFILWFGFELTPKILLIVVIAFFPECGLALARIGARPSALLDPVP